MSRLALAAAACGIISWSLWILSGAIAGLGLLHALPLIVAPGALSTAATIVLAHLARQRAKRKRGAERGSGWTIAALSLGYGSLAIAPFLLGAFYFLQTLQQSPANTLDAARDQAGAQALRNINVAEHAYRKIYEGSFSPTLEALGTGKAAVAGPNHAGLINPELAAGKFQGYQFLYEPVSETQNGKVIVTHFRVTARPTEEAKSTSSFFTDDTGIIRQSNTGDATASSPQVP